MNETTGISGQGLLMIVIGLWLVLRTINKDSSGRTLIDHITGKQAANELSSSSSINLGPVSSVNSFLGKQVFSDPFSIPKYNLGPVTKVNSAIGNFVTHTAPNAIGNFFGGLVP